MEIDSENFGEVLQNLRNRKKLSRSRIAQQLAIHPSTLEKWERGDVLPDRGRVEELIHALKLTDAEERLLREAHAGYRMLPSLHNLPAPPNHYFTGRETILTQLHQQLVRRGQGRPLQAINGLGGIGKTQLALHYAYRFSKAYTHILWVNAESQDTLTMDFVRLAQSLEISEKDVQDQNKIVRAVQRWLREYVSWLLILDNIDDFGLISSFIPVNCSGSVLLTTRRQATETIAHTLKLEVFSEDDGVLFLLKRATGLPSNDLPDTARTRETIIARTIAQQLGGLPLALDQAGAYILETGCSFSDYLQLYQRNSLKLLEQRGQFDSSHPASVKNTFSIIFQQVEQVSPAALDLLRLCTFLYPEAIPEQILLEGAAHSTPLLQVVSADAFAFNHALGLLHNFSLLHRDSSNKTAGIQRLVQTILRGTMDDSSRLQWITSTIDTINRLFPLVEGAYFEALNIWPLCEKYLPHAQAAINWIIQEKLVTPAAAQLLQKVGKYVGDRGRYREGEQLLLRALDMSQQLPQINKMELASCLNDLATLYFYQGKYHEVISYYDQLRPIYEHIFGPAHPLTIQNIDFHAWPYLEMGYYAQAEQLLREALLHEGQSPDLELIIGHAKVGLAICFIEQNLYDQAEALLMEVMQVFEHLLGPNNLAQPGLLYRQASIRIRQRNYAEAERLSRQSIALWEASGQFQHPLRAYLLSGLVLSLLPQGKLQEAEEVAQQAVDLAAETMDELHLWRASCLEIRAQVFQARQEYAQAEKLYQQVLSIQRQVLVPDHPWIARVRNRLASLENIQKVLSARQIHGLSLFLSEIHQGRAIMKQIPKPLKPFVGRQQEVAHLLHLLKETDNRLFTIVGMAGVGKTQFALQVAYEAQNLFPDGIFLIFLDSLIDPNLLLPTLAHASGAINDVPNSDVEGLCSFLKEKRLLLLLDNFEHLMSASPLLPRILDACPALRILVTSRAGLNVRGEQQFPLSSLNPPSLIHSHELEAIAKNPSVALFLTYTRMYQPDFELTSENVHSIMQICAYLEGLPLAIELAATTGMQLFSPQVLLERLKQHPLDILMNEERDAPERQQTVRKTIDWSYSLLNAQEQRLFRRLAAFTGGATMEALEVLYEKLGEKNNSLLREIRTLVNHHLILSPSEGSTDVVHFRMLQVIRAYGQERMAAEAETKDIEWAYVTYFLDLVKEIEPQLSGPAQLRGLDILEQEQNNLRAVFTWLMEHDKLEHALYFTAGLWKFWFYRGTVSEGYHSIEQALKMCQGKTISAAARARAHYAASILLYFRDYNIAGLEHVQASLRLYQEAEDRHGYALALNILGYYELSGKNYAAVRACYEESIPILHEMEDRWHLAEAYGLIAREASAQNNYERAHELHKQCIEISREVGDRRALIQGLVFLGQTILQRENYEEALSIYREKASIAIELGGKSLIAASLAELAEIAIILDQETWAAILGGARETLCEVHLVEVSPEELSRIEDLQAKLRAKLTEEDLTKIWAQGRTMSPQQALTAYSSSPETFFTQSSIPTDQTSQKTSHHPTHLKNDLTKREKEVLRLVAEGLADKEIATRLHMRPRTVNSHLTKIYQKLRVSSRSGAVGYALKNRLI